MSYLPLLGILVVVAGFSGRPPRQASSARYKTAQFKRR